MRPLTWLRQELRSRPYVADTTLAVFLYAAALLSPVAPQRPGEMWRDPQPLTAYSIVLATVVCGALAFRRRWPRAVLAVTVTGFVAQLMVAGGRSPLDLALGFAVYTVAARHPRRDAWAYGALVALVVTVGRVVFAGSSWLAPEVLGQIAPLGMATAIGDALRSRRAYVAAIEERAPRAEETREEEAERRVMEERLHIARELHDVLAHHIALINVQAAGRRAPAGDRTRAGLARRWAHHVAACGQVRRWDELRTTVGAPCAS